MTTTGLHAAVTRAHPYPLVFATITGSHAFGIASPTSDYDIHGVHLLPLSECLGLGTPHETIERKGMYDAERREIDIATHDLRKFVMLLLKGNGNVLEDLYSPLVVSSTPVHAELKELGKGCITKMLANHYKGMAFNQQRRMLNNEVKKWLHTYRCLLMGIHLMRTGVLEMNLPALATEYKQTQVHNLILLKMQGLDFVPDADTVHHEVHLETLRTQLDDAQQQSTLLDKASEETRKALEDLVIRVRLKT